MAQNLLPSAAIACQIRRKFSTDCVKGRLKVHYKLSSSHWANVSLVAFKEEFSAGYVQTTELMHHWLH